MRAIIVGDGPSARGFVPPDGVLVVAVKRAIDWLPRADLWFSLDPNAASFARMQDQRPGVRYFCAVDGDEELPAGVTRLRRLSARRTGKEPRLRNSPTWWLWRWGGVCGLSERPGVIHSGNSAYGALGLVYLMGARDVLLVGVDGTADARVSDGQAPRELCHLPLLFRSAMRQVRLSTVGTLDGIPHTSLAEWLRDNPRD